MPILAALVANADHDLCQHMRSRQLGLQTSTQREQPVFINLLVKGTRASHVICSARCRRCEVRLTNSHLPCGQDQFTISHLTIYLSADEAIPTIATQHICAGTKQSQSNERL